MLHASHPCEHELLHESHEHLEQPHASHFSAQPQEPASHLQSEPQEQAIVAVGEGVGVGGGQGFLFFSSRETK